MESQEIRKEMNMNYGELVQYLLKKYGGATCDYFTDETCRIKSRRISRTEEGLFCHHIDEDKGINLSDPEYAIEQPFEYQKSDRLVYCNYIEHLLLHMIIGAIKFWDNHSELTKPNQFSYFIVPGISYICSEINKMYDNMGTPWKWQKQCFREIENNFADYICVLNSFIQYILENYTGNREQKEIAVGQHVVHKKLGEGIIIEIGGEEIVSKVVVQFPNYKINTIRGKIDRGDYQKEIEKLKKELSAYRGSSIELVYSCLLP